MTDELTCRFETLLPVSRREAFTLLLEGTGNWWSPLLGKDDEATSGIEPYRGGRCFELGDAQQASQWGTVLSIEEPLYVRFAWQVGPNGEAIPDPAAASRVVVSFWEMARGARVEVAHTDFLRHGPHARAVYDLAVSEKGWPGRLERLQGVAAKQKKSKA